tara:strand:+ start:270 stop:1049 length:780 start_codon:yes stop_codon:yes gene_type:complete
MSLRYQELLGQARKNAPKARAKSAPAKSRFVDENDDAKLGGIMGRRISSALLDDEDFMTKAYNKVVASNQTLAEQMKDLSEPTGEDSSTSAMTGPDGNPLDVLNKGEDAINDSPTVVAQDNLWNAIEFSESSGRPDAENTVQDGRRFVGKLQFGWARLQDYMRDEGGAFTLDDFKDDETLQGVVAEWHKKDIRNQIEKLGNLPEGFNNKSGLTAVAHLGGLPGMRKFIKSRGKYNPHDGTKENPGTYLSDYYAKFSKIK